ncbi:tetratricopeptide repeat protein [Candidatus Peregrinibacteria bacterium]|nr:tetratricopeptide repeat protein [Candidatus Peregrinibacteria bacterium]
MKKNIFLMIVLIGLIVLPGMIKFVDGRISDNHSGKMLIDYYLFQWEMEYDFAKQAFDDGQSDDAIQRLDYILETIPCNQFRNRLSKIKINSFVLLAQVYEEQGSFNKATKVYKGLTGFVPNGFEYFYRWGEAEFEMEDYDKALDLFEEALSIYPDHIPSVEAKIRTLFVLNDYNEMLGYYDHFRNSLHFNNVESGQLYLGNDEEGFSSKTFVPVRDILIVDKFETYSVDLSKNTFWQDNAVVNKMRLDPADNYGFEPIEIVINKMDFLKKGVVVKTFDDFGDWELRNLSKINANVFITSEQDSHLFKSVDFNLRDMDLVNIEMKITKTVGPEILELINSANEKI